MRDTPTPQRYICHRDHRGHRERRPFASSVISVSSVAGSGVVVLTAVTLAVATTIGLGCGEVVHVYSPPPRAFSRVPVRPRPRQVEPTAASGKTGETGSASLHGEVLRAPPGQADDDDRTTRPGDDTVVATVNGRPITHGDLVKELMVRHGKAVLEDLIRTEAVEQEVARAGLTVREEEIEGELTRERLGFRTDRRGYNSFEDMVRERYGMSMEGYRGIVRRGLLIRKVILRRENPSEDEILLWFYQNRERYDVPAEITVRHIFISKEDPDSGTPRQEAWVRARLEKIRKGLIRDEDFGELAERYSDDDLTRKKGGQLGTVNERAAKLHLDPAFYEAMMVLGPGQAGGPVETRKGYHFIKVTARKDGRRVEYHAVAPLVRVDYREERAALVGEVFLRGLMERTRITRGSEAPKR